MNARNLPSHGAMVRRITRAYRRTSQWNLSAGLGWYAEAWRVAQAIDPVDPQRVAGVIAALSPRCQWSTNVAWTRALIASIDAGLSVPAVHTETMRAQAARIARGEDPLSVLNGPKVRAFYRAICGDDSVIVVDVWAAYAATGVRADWTVATPARYRRVAAAYARAAEILQVPARDVQAAVWVSIRGVKPTDAGFHSDAAMAA